MQYQQNARICQGDDKTLIISLDNPGGVDLAGSTAKYSASESPLGDVILNRTGNVVMSPPHVEVPITGGETQSLKPGDYYHEVTLTLATAANVTVMSGTLRVDPSRNSFVPPMVPASALRKVMRRTPAVPAVQPAV